jgi:hypothetical protein
MGMWNDFLKERDDAPLDHIKQMLHTKWSVAKTWFEDACCEDDDAPTCDAPEGTSGVAALNRMGEDRKEVICMSGYDEVDSATSQGAGSPPPIPSPEEAEASSDTVTTHFSCDPPVGTSLHLSQQLRSGSRDIPDSELGKKLEEDECRYVSEAFVAHSVDANDILKQSASNSQPEAPHPSSTLEVSSSSNKFSRPDISPADSPVENSSTTDGSDRQSGQHSSHNLQKGSSVDVWSKSQNAWCRGVVLEAFPVESCAQGYKVPAGTLNVGFGNSVVKWIKPAQVHQLLRAAEKPE